MSRKLQVRGRAIVRRAVAELLEQRAYLAVSFDSGRLVFNTDPLATFAIAKLNTDSNLDLAVAVSSTSTTRSLLGAGNGNFTFKNGKTNGVLVPLRTGDLDGDGGPDVLGASGNNREIYAHYVDADGFLNSAVLQYTYGTAAVFDFTTADMTGDGLADIIVYGSNGLKIQRRNSNGTYTQIYNQAFAGPRPAVQAIDVNNDGRRDLLVGISDSAGNALGVILQNSDGTFQSVKRTALSGKPIQIRAGRFNADDTNMDVVVLSEPATGTSDGIIDMLMGNNNGTFKFVHKVLVGGAKGIAAADFDLDGRADVVASGSVRSFTVLRTGLDGSIERVTAASVTTATDQIDQGDFNNDGKPDVLVREIGTQNLKLYLNTTTKQGSVRGLVWNDSNQNQAKDGGEAVMPGTLVFADQDDDGVFDTNEISTSVLADGRWEMLLPAGTHRIRARLGSGFGQSFPYTHPLVSKTTAHSVTVSAGGVVSNLNIGLFDGGDIQGFVFNDYNASQAYEIIESGLPSFTVFLDTNANGLRDTSEPSTTTDGTGRYKFNISTNNTYRVRVLSQTGWTATTPLLRTVTASPTTSATLVNFGFTKPATISGVVYYDFAANRRLDESEDVGVGGLQVFLDNDNDGVLDAREPSTTTSTSADPAQKGRYKFTNLTPKTYNVRLVKPTGYQQLSPSSAGAGTGGAFVTFAFGGLDTFFTDFGVIRPVQVSGRAFRDSDADGTIDSAETGLRDVPVFIDYDGDGTADLNEPYLVTGTDGSYTLTSTRQGTFSVRAIRQSGFNSTVPSSSLHSVTFTYGAATTTGKNFGFREGAFNTSPYQSPINIATGSNPTALAAGDFNGDGKQDFIVASNSSISQVFLGQGNGLFTAGQQFSIGDSTRYVIATDVSGDGKPDLVAANEAFDFGATVLIGNGNGTFQSAVGYEVTTNTYGVAAADFNGDGKRDLAYVGTSDGRVAILTNKGNGTFNTATFVSNTFGGRSISAGDVNNDGKADLVVAHPNSNAVSVLLGNGNATFTRVATDITSGLSTPIFITMADLNADGRRDLVILNDGGDSIRVKLGNGNGTFQTGLSYITGPTPTQVAVLDIDRDGNLDLIASCRSDGTTDISGDVSIHRGRGDGTFVDRQIRTAHTSPTAVAIADYNGDGKLDIVAANFFSDDVSLLINGTAGALGSIKGTIWNNVDNDATFDSTEIGLAGQTVFSDTDNDGVYDLGERTARTASNGTFAFTDLPAGTYRLRVVVPNELVQNSPTNRNANTITLSAGQDATGANIGLTPTEVANEFVFDDRTAVQSGTWTRTTGTGQFGGDYLHDNNTNKGSTSARFDLKLRYAGYFAVQVRWVAGSDRASNVPIDIKSGTNTRTVTVDQRSNGGTWVNLGVYKFSMTGGTITIRNGGTNGRVVADAVKLVPVAPPPTSTKDNSDGSGITITGTWLTATTPAGFNGGNYLHDGNPSTKGGRSVKFTPTFSTGAGIYEVFGRWTALPDRATNARYDVVTAFGTVSVFANQRTNGGTWVSLGFFDLNPATASVTIRNDGANGLVVADAVQFVRVQ